MKGTILGVAVMCLATVNAWGVEQKQRPAAVQLVGERGSHWQTVQNFESYQDDQGAWQYQTNTYVHLEPGLNYLNDQGQWTESKEEFELLPQGAVARQGQHQVTLPANLNGNQPVTLVQPDGQVLTSRPHGLAYYDAATGEAVLLAELKDCQGFQIAPNQILYTDAFDDIQADVRYTYTKGGFEQDIVLKQAPPAPERYGLSSATTRLEVWSEFFQAPTPNAEARTLNADAVSAGTESPFVDNQLDFGAMKMAAGRAFQTGTQDESAVPVAKSWIQDQGRTFLIEAVELPAVQPDLQVLPQTPGGAALKHKPGKRETALRQLPAAGKAQKKQQAAIRPATKELLTALIGPSLVLDYSTLIPGNLTNQTFLGDTTYYLVGAFTLTGTNSVFEAGTVLKYAITNSPSVTVKTPLSWQGTLYHPVVLTAKDDKSVGDNVTGASGTPTGYYAATALYLDGSAGGANGSFTLAHARIAYAQTAIVLNQQTGHVLSHLQLVACQNGISATNASFNVRNALFANVTTNFLGSSATGLVEQATVSGANYFNAGGFGTNNLSVVNSLFYLVTNAGSYVGTAVSTVSSNPFTTVKGGSYYLASGSIYRNAGTTALSPALAFDLTKLTTYAPVELTTNFTANTTLVPQAQRDTDLPDLGYHYPPLDYLWSNLSLTGGKTLTLLNGVAVGFYGSLGLTANGPFNSTGLPNALNRLTLLNTVQEQTQGIVTNGNTFSLRTATTNLYATAFRFTDIAFVAAPPTSRQLSDYGNPIGDVTLQDCQLRGVYWYYLGDSYSATHTFTLQNSVFSERSQLNLGQGYSTFPNTLILTLRNNLFSYATLSLTHAGGYYGAWALFDNLFDSASINLTEMNPSPNGSLLGSGAGYNAFINTTNPLGGTNNRTGLLRDFVSGPLGGFYYPTNSITNSLSTLINSGSQNATNAGLYHYTTTTDQKKETNSTVDIGFHYVATVSFLASDGFTSTQGSNGWSYVRSTTALGSTWLYLTNYGIPLSGYTNVWYDSALTGDNFYTWIAKDYQHPGATDDSARAFQSPLAGAVIIDGSVYDGAPSSHNGVQFRILDNLSTLLPWTAMPEATPATNPIPAKVVSPTAVQPGDLFFFQVNCTASNYSDLTYWNPRITYDQPVDSDGDGIPDYFEDSNGDGVQNSSDGTKDTDGDGVIDRLDARPFDPDFSTFTISIELPVNGSTVN